MSMNTNTWPKGCSHPFTDFGSGWRQTEYPNPTCICNKPLLLYIPAGEHVHLNCSVHGDFVVYVSSVTYTSSKNSWEVIV
jgi:hypothetical protein